MASQETQENQNTEITTTASNTTPQPQPIKVDGRYYYNSKDLQAFKPEYYYGFTTKPRNIISKKGIPNWEYVYATYEKALTRWNQSNESCKKAQLLISKQWVDENYFKPSSSSSSSTIEKKKIVVMKKKTLQPQQPQTPQQPQQSQPQTPQQPQQSQPQTPQRDSEVLPVHEYEEEEEEVFEEENGHQQEVENAPPVLYLDDAEKFHDADGNVIEIETRGERHEDKIYFKMKDVSVGFGMPRLNDTLTNKERGYTRNIDFKTMFIRSKHINDVSWTIKKCLFLTYEGMLRVLFASRNKNATLFRKWATNKLFTIQMGTRDQKMKLGAEVLNTSPRTLKAIFDKHAATFPSIYLMSLGKVRELRETFEIPSNKPDESTVYKFGFTEDLSRRVIELEAEYSKLPGVTMTVGTFHIIDTKYTSEAENEVREMCAAFEVRVKKTTQGFNELIVLDDKQFANMKKMYRRIGDDFAGATLGLQKQIAELKEKIKDYENEIVHLKQEIEYKGSLHKKDIELKDTVIENWKLKHQLATMANNARN
jgi:hypothetical protein